MLAYETADISFGNIAVSDSSTTQNCVALSTSEAECVAIAHRETTALAIKAVLYFVQPHQLHVSSLRGDKDASWNPPDFSSQ